MADYKYKILKDKTGYHYALLPNNNDSQEIAYSVDAFGDRSTCHEALVQMKSMVKMAKLKSITIEPNKQSDKKWYPIFSIDNKAVFYRRKGYYQKSSCEAWKKRILNNIDAELK